MVKLLDAKAGAASVAISMPIPASRARPWPNSLASEAGRQVTADPPGPGCRGRCGAHRYGVLLPGGFSQIVQAVEAGKNVICIAEEMAFPHQQQPELAAQIHKLAVENKVTVLGTGINPGFVLDLLIVALTGVCYSVRGNRASRINDLSPFGPTVMKTQGVGTTSEEFAAGVEAGTIVATSVFRVHCHDCAAWAGRLDEIRQTKEPIIAKKYRKLPMSRSSPAWWRAAATLHTASRTARPSSPSFIPSRSVPRSRGGDRNFIEIYGEPDIRLVIRPEIPRRHRHSSPWRLTQFPMSSPACPGLKNTTQLPVPSALMADIRTLMEKRRDYFGQ